MADNTVPDYLLFTQEHEWAQNEDDVVTVGISDYAQDALGEIVYVELPPLGKEVNKGDELAVVESCKAASDVYAPVSGIIVEVNEALADSPALINESPYEDGWLVRIEPSDATELEELMDAANYREHIG